ncbi:unnamed protein product [Prunus brigantina]
MTNYAIIMIYYCVPFSKCRIKFCSSDLWRQHALIEPASLKRYIHSRIKPTLLAKRRFCLSKISQESCSAPMHGLRPPLTTWHYHAIMLLLRPQFQVCNTRFSISFEKDKREKKTHLFGPHHMKLVLISGVRAQSVGKIGLGGTTPPRFHPNRQG